MLGRFKQGHWPIFFMSILASMVNLVLPIILVRILTPEDIGRYKIFFLYMQVITFLSMAGGPLYSVYYWIGKREAESRDYLKQSWLLSLILSVIAIFIPLPFTDLIASRIELSATQMRWLLVAAATTAPAAYYGEYLVSKGKRVAGSLINSGFELLKGALIIAAAYLFKDINLIFVAYTALFALKLLLNIALGIKANIFSLKINRPKMKEVFLYCAPISFSGTLAFFVDKVDMILLSSMIEPGEFAYYSLGCLSVPPLILLEMSVQKVLIPDLSKSYHSGKSSEGLHYFKKAQREIGFLMIPAVAGLIVFARPIMELLFTAEYLSAASYLQVFALGYLAHIFPHDSVPRASGKTAWLLKIYLIFTPITLIAVYLCAHFWGAMGALVSSILFKFIPKIPNFLYSAKIMKWDPYQMIAANSLLRFIALALILSALSQLAAPLFSSERWWFFSCAPLFALIYLGFFYFIKKGERV